ncbi:trypsin-like isoform X2 [Portunus trituberculatus]|uniref:trypsin-like isoform X2 n=1 Tax=Portunus trituberculatus TaxID=210409 RepID=UPI001E1CB19C|nr:trypsin-like isoform X2 [Portunus trituberculatus]
MKACSVLVLVAVACVPALAQEGGEYVDPKQGEYVDPKQSCGGTMTVGAEPVVITSPNHPNDYANRQRCKWRFTAEDPDDALFLSCEEFSVLCKGDRLNIIEGGVVQERLCGSDPVEYASEGNVMVLKFRTNRRGTSSGFSCTVTSSSYYEGSSSSSSSSTEEGEENTTPSSNTGSCKCGVPNLNRIVGGQEVNPKNKYPWQVGLKMSNGRNYWCGGSIINDRYVMTAAHCIYGMSSTNSGLMVGVGDHNMYQTSDDVSGATRLVAVERIIQHPDYNTRTLDNDIALLKLSETLDLTQYKEVGAVCLPADDSKTYAGELATASGWGTTSSGGSQPSTLYEVVVPILEPSCWGMSVTANMLCAGLEEGGKDTCQGDSGGPLYVEENSVRVQVGITSWGYGCADANSPGVYARVSKYVSWIQQNTQDATYCQ